MRRSTLNELFAGALLLALVATSVGATLHADSGTGSRALEGAPKACAREKCGGGQCGGTGGGGVAVGGAPQRERGGGHVAAAGGSGSGCGDGKSLPADCWLADGGAGSGAGDPLAEACGGCGVAHAVAEGDMRVSP